MNSQIQNRKAVARLGDIIQELFDEVNVLPLSDTAKTAMVMIMLGDILKIDGRTIYMNFPLDPAAQEEMVEAAV